MQPSIAFLFGLAVVQAASGLEIPFEFLHNQIVLRATVGGRGPFNFIVDTGTRDSIIDLDLARRLGLDIGPLVPVAGAGGGRSTGRQAICPELRIGDLQAGDLKVAVLDLAGISRSLGRPLHGVLGFGFLNSRVVQIDYFQRRIRFLDAPLQGGGNTGAVTFRMQFGPESVLPILDDFYINGAKVTVTLDTGSSMGLVLFPKAVKSLGLDELAREGIPLRASGYLGEAQLTKGWVRSVKLKSIDLGAIEVAYVRKGYGDAEDLARRGGNLGNAVLEDFVLTLDYRNRTVTLEKVAE